MTRSRNLRLYRACQRCRQRKHRCTPYVSLHTRIWAIAHHPGPHQEQETSDALHASVRSSHVSLLDQGEGAILPIAEDESIEKWIQPRDKVAIGHQP